MLIVHTCTVEEQERTEFITKACKLNGLRHLVNRERIFADTLAIYSECSTILDEYPFSVKFEGENAVDAGGVSRDMFSAFWEAAYQELFDGGALLSPVAHSDIEMKIYPLLGVILSHGYLVSGFLPIRIAFPSLVTMLRGQVKIPEHILTESFIDSLNVHEAQLIKQAICSKSAFPEKLKGSLVALFARYGCRKIPSPQSVKEMIIHSSRYEFLVKPCAALTAMFAAIPPKHKVFWEKKTVHDLYDLYSALSVTPSKLISMLSCDETNPNEERIVNYLIQFIGTMTSDELRSFLRFVTGSSVCPSNGIQVTFNHLSGFARRPISHTCDCVLELPVEYKSSLEFITEFRTILTASENVWVMDGV